MARRTPLPLDALTFLKDQEGLITRRQLVALELTDRTIERMTRSWTRVSKGLYLTRAPTFRSAVWAGVLHGRDGVVGGAAACFLHGAVRDEPRAISVWTKAPRSGITIGAWEVGFRRGTRKSMGSPPRSMMEDALLDMASRAGETDVIAAVTRALAQGMTLPSRLLQNLEKRGRQRHSAVIRELCRVSGVESVLEWIFLRDVVRAHGLPVPTLQHGSEVGRVDGHYGEFGLLLELDGMRDHSDWSKDMMRDNEHVLAGRQTLRYGFHAATRDRCKAARQLAKALNLLGWRGTIRPCAPDQACAPSTGV